MNEKEGESDCLAVHRGHCCVQAATLAATLSFETASSFSQQLWCEVVMATGEWESTELSYGLFCFVIPLGFRKAKHGWESCSAVAATAQREREREHGHELSLWGCCSALCPSPSQPCFPERNRCSFTKGDIYKISTLFSNINKTSMVYQQNINNSSTWKPKTSSINLLSMKISS